MLEIYFDGVLLDQNKYLSLTQKGKMFDKEFKLGTVTSREFKLTIPKADFNPNTKKVLIKYMSNDYAHLIIDSYEYSEGGIPTVDLTLVDKMVLADFGYDASPLVPTTTLAILQDICNKMGVVLGTTDFLNNDILVDFYDNTVTARQYISYIAEIAGGFARIENDGKLYIRNFSNENTNGIIIPELCEQILIGKKHRIERVVYDNGLEKLEKVIQTSNLFNASIIYREDITVKENGRIIELPIATEGNGYTNTYITLEEFCPELKVGDTMVLDFDTNSQYNNFMYLNGASVYLDKNVPVVVTEEMLGSTFIFYANRANEGETEQVTISNFRINKNTIKPFEPYGNIEKTIIGDTDETSHYETIYLSPDNVYIVDEIMFKNIADKILGFEYWNIDTGKTYVLPSNMAGDVLKLTYENQDYYTIEQFEELNFLGSWQGKYKLEIDSGLQQETKVKGINTQVKAIKVTLNRNDNTLQIVLSDISAQKDTNQDLINKIQANQTAIEQTAKSISLSVEEITGQLNSNIENLGDDLKQITDGLQEQIITQQALIQVLKDSITSTIKQTGGNNLLRNSVGLAGLDFWTSTGTVTDSQDSYTEQNTVSGSKFVLNGDSTLRQTFNTQVGNTYGVSFKLRHIANGTANPVYVRIHRTEMDYDEVLLAEEQTTAYENFQEFSTYTYVSTTAQPFIELICTGDDVLEISDLIVSIGENQSWSGYFDEVYGKEHRLDKYGLVLTDLASGNQSKVTNNTVQLTDNNEIVAELSKLQVKSDTGMFTNKIQLRNLQMVALDNSNIVEYV